MTRGSMAFGMLVALRPAAGLLSKPAMRRPVAALHLWGAFSSAMSAKKEIDYTKLAGLPASLGREAAEYAVNKQTPVQSKDGHDLITFAGGCFWGIELAFQRVPGVVGTCVGYCQGQVERPTYDEVCAATTGHTEAVLVSYDPKVVSFDALCEVFWDRLGDSAVKYHQVGNDRGPQYRSGIYPSSPKQLEDALASREALQKNYKKPITTEVEMVQIFYPAEEYHQQYLEKGGRFSAPQSAEKGATETIRCYG